MAASASLADRFAVERVLGEGGMGVVYLARDLVTGERVALKCLKQTDDGARRRLLREARAAAAVRHPAVVQVLDVLDLDDGPALVLELLEGESLGARLAREPVLPLRFVARIMGDVCDALLAAHALGIVHRDLKPDNIFLTHDEAHPVKVLDFGIAKLTALDGETQATAGLSTTTGTLVGTPMYMAPEQVFGDQHPDARIDVWAMGLILHECLTGILPTRADNVGQVLRRIVADTIPPLHDTAPELPEDLCAVIDRMLVRRREERAPEVDALRAVLARYTEAELPAIAARAPADPPGATRAATTEAGGPGPEARPDPPRPIDPLAATAPTGPIPRRRSSLWRLVASAALVAGIGATTVVAMRPRDAPGPPQPAPAVRRPANEMVVACPPLVASGVEEPSGWLGAAAAAVVCARVRWMLGGAGERTLVPAELLALPAEPGEAYPIEPYGEPEARTRALGAARTMRADLLLDGAVERREDGFRVTLEARSAETDARLGAAEGRGAALYQAVRQAMNGLVAAGALPVAPRLDADAADLFGSDRVAVALAESDLIDANVGEADDFVDECSSARAAFAAAGVSIEAVDFLCGYVRGDRVLPLRVPTADFTSPGSTLRTVSARFLSGQSLDNTAILRDLTKAREGAQRPADRALLATLESWAKQVAHDGAGATNLALLAARADPEVSWGVLWPWSQVLQCTDGSSHHAAAARAARAWRPDFYDSWTAIPPGEAPATALRLMRRAAVLAPRKPVVLDQLAGLLMDAGDTTAARVLATRLQDRGSPAQRAQAALMSLRVDAADGRVAATMRQALAGLRSLEGGGYVDTLRVELAWRALVPALLLGRAPEIGDAAYATLVAPEPPLLDRHWPATLPRIAALCAHATRPVAAACFTRLRALSARGHFAAWDDASTWVLDGAAAYAAGDFAAAARAWRVLVATPGVQAEGLLHPMADAFERVGETGLAERADAAGAPVDTNIRGVKLGDLRAARRASRRGDRPAAAAIAARVATAWATLDEAVPALDEMRRLSRGAR